MRMLEESHSDWVETSHPRVYYRSNTDQWYRGEFALSSVLADHLSEWTIVVEMGSNRDEDITWTIYPDESLIHLDCDVDGKAAYRVFQSEQYRLEAEYAISVIIMQAKAAEDLD